MAKIQPVVKPAVSIFWFRRDLRLHDNHGLFEALRSGIPVLPLFVFDQNILSGLHDPKDKRVNFIHHVLQLMQDELKSHGSSLCIQYGKPEQVFEKLLSEFQVASVFTNHDYEPYAIQRDDAVSRLLTRHQIPFHSFKDQVIFEKNEVVKADGTPYTIFTPYSKAWKGIYLSQSKARYPSEKHLNRFYPAKPLHFPSLSEIGFEESGLTVPPAKPDKAIIMHYEETRNLPYLRGTSRLSVHLRFGTVSVRELAAKAAQWNDTWLNELIWREFFMMILYQFPEVVTRSFKPKYETIEWRNNQTEFSLWCKGETGYPLVDAGMRELNETGFMHNRVRMVVASFLTKHLLIDWRWGEGYFAEKLLDYELSSNNGNWQWCAGCGCDAAPYFRIFNPVEQQKKFDPDFVYIQKWIPDFRPRYLEPVVAHEFARKRALTTFQKALREA